MVAVALRGVTWQELDARLQARLAPLIRTQVTQAEVQIAMAAELQRLEADVRTLRAELLAQRFAHCAAGGRCAIDAVALGLALAGGDAGGHGRH